MSAISSTTNSYSSLSKLNEFVFTHKRALLISLTVAVAAAAGTIYLTSSGSESSKLDKSKKKTLKKKNKKKASTNTSKTDLTANSDSKSQEISDSDLLRLTKSEIEALTSEKRSRYAFILKANGNKAFQAKKYEEAIDCYSKAIDCEKKAVYYSNRAACHTNLNNAEAVIEDCTEALRLDKYYIKALNRRAAARELLGGEENLFLALCDFTACVILDEFKTDTKGATADRVMKRYASEKAKSIIKERGPRLPPNMIIRAYLDAFRPKPKPELPAEPNQADNTLMLAYDALSAFDYKHAFTLFQEAASQVPSTPELRAHAYMMNATSLFLTGQSQAALDEFNRSLIEKPNFGQAWIRKASVDMELGSLEIAMNDFEEALKLGPNDPDVYYHRGQVYNVTEQHRLAIRDYQRSIELDPSFIFSHVQLAVAIYKTGDVSKAMDMFKEYLIVDGQESTSPEVHNYYGELLFAEQHFDEALKRFDSAIALEAKRPGPRNALPWVNKALVYSTSQSDLPKAIECCLKAIQVDENCEVAIQQIAQFKLQLNKIREAIQWYEKGIEIAMTELGLSQILQFDVAAKAQLAFVENYPEYAARLAKELKNNECQGGNSFDIEDLRAALSVSDSGAILKRQVEIDRLGEGITPRLTNDGLTFHWWYRSLNRLIERTHRQVNYFDSEEKDADRERNAEIRSLIEKYIDASLRSSIEDEDEARLSFACLRHQFEKLSWSHVMNLFDDIVNATEASHNLAEAYAATKKQCDKLEKHFHEISTAMDTKVSIERSINIKSNDILQIAQRFQKQTANPLSINQPSIMAASSSRQHSSTRGMDWSNCPDKSNIPPRARPPGTRIPISQQTKSWARHFLSPKLPCLHCFEWGHWAQDCLRKKAGKPPLEDPRIKHPGVTLRKSNTVSHPCITEVEAEEEEDPFVAVIQSIPEDKSPTTSDIPGVVISIGKFMRNDGEVHFKGGRFTLQQNICTYTSILRRDRWFLLVNSAIACNAISDSTSQEGDLLHRCLAHISLRSIRQMQTLNCVRGLPNIAVNHDVRLCRTCSLAKSQHAPFRPESRSLVTQPGDVVVADLMGPFPQSFDKKVYGMIIQDHFSSLVTFYALKNKSEAPQFLMNWIIQFTNLTPHSVKRLRTDNAGEFLSKSLTQFLTQRGIVHETIVPYEHHQAGKVERTNRTVAEGARSMLIERDLGTALWPYAFQHACWIFNRVLHAGNHKTPYELITKRKPDLAPLRVFGCRAYVHNLNHRKDLLAKSRELIHIGIAENSQGWR
ncbi:hypothetical protein O181_019333 [Austropuccinia psidii MF-1]|uniref:Integrase catalytic domain-containing protein n=1 Tax=Austropuccinia psidii MF-1 TaxID=1389203 RepID=A0A9Q3GTH8_9BASI|nr:hypothetical protein [Austropuccinia psidii MF-1]